MLHLASKSPRRIELLARLGLRFAVLELDVPEVRATGEPAQDYVRRVAREKAGAGLLEVMAVPGAVVLGADTEVVLDDEVFGKPADAAAAAAMLRRLSGRTHQVISAVSVVSAGREAQAVSVSQVSFATLDEALISAYAASASRWARPEATPSRVSPNAFVTRLDGSYSGVMGLPLYETSRLLTEFGVD